MVTEVIVVDFGKEKDYSPEGKPISMNIMSYSTLNVSVCHIYMKLKFQGLSLNTL